MKPINPTQPNSPRPERETAPQPNAPSERDQQVFSDMMRQRQREQHTREQSENSPESLYHQRDAKTESKRRDDWDPDMPLDNPSDEQMKGLQKQQRDQQERVARRREEHGRQPSQHETAGNESEHQAADGSRRDSNLREPQTRSTWATSHEQTRAFEQSQGQTRETPAPRQPQAEIRPAAEPAPRPGTDPAPANSGGTPTNPTPTEPGTNPATTADNTAAQGAASQSQVQWQGFNPPPKKAPTLGKPLPEAGTRTETLGNAANSAAQLSGDHILAGLRRRQGDGEGSGGSGGDEGYQPQNAGEAILGMLQQNHQSNDVTKVQAAKSAQMISDIAEKIVDRILVSNTSLNNNKDEVRLLLKNTVLPETEVRISRHGGQLEIQLVTKDTDAYRLLNERADGLQHFLKERLRNNEVNVRLQFDEAGAEAGNNHSGRDSDGRSRQQRNLADEIEAQDQP